MLPDDTIKIEEVCFSYPAFGEEVLKQEGSSCLKDTQALKNVEMEIKKGELVAVLGANGSGKSTLAKHLNALLLPQKGDVRVFGKHTADKEKLLDIRKNVGMVFQNPDNQIVGSIVEEDVGFGLENLCVPTEEIWLRVKDALRLVNMQQYGSKSPNRLSGGQKQRIAIAGVLAMKPSCIVLDEATAMLDPKGRRSVMNTVYELNKQGVTVIVITHYMDEVVNCDRVFLMSDGELCRIGGPREIFSLAHELEHFKLAVPYITELTLLLKKYLPDIAIDSLFADEIVDDIIRIYEKTVPNLCCQEEYDLDTQEDDGVSETENQSAVEANRQGSKKKNKETVHKEELLRLEHVSYSYSIGTSFTVDAVKDICLSIYKGEFLGIIGHTGSGKSTLIQHFNGLHKPTEGEVYYKNQNIFDKKYSLKKHKADVGMVFQYAEQQLFEATVLEDVCFGPLNLGYSLEEAKEMSKKALFLVGLDESFYERSPFFLSGGQKRRVAIAGVLAMQPNILVLDEPTAGLDPIGKRRILDLLKDLRDKEGMTIVMVSHSMEDIAEYTNRVIVMNRGEIVMDDSTAKVLSRSEELKGMDLDTSLAHEILYRLKERGLPVDTEAVTIRGAVNHIVRAIADKAAKKK